jgi:hypothetical protein
VNGLTRTRLFVRRVLGEDVSNLTCGELAEKYEEARVVREFEVGIMQEAIVKALGGK